MECEGGKMRWVWSMFKLFVKNSWHKYKKMPFYGKVSFAQHRIYSLSTRHVRRILFQMVIWSLAVFYISLGSFMVWVGADRIAQSMYDFAQKISHLQFGWLILGGMLG